MSDRSQKLNLHLVWKVTYCRCSFRQRSHRAQESRCVTSWETDLNDAFDSNVQDMMKALGQTYHHRDAPGPGEAWGDGWGGTRFWRLPAHAANMAMSLGSHDSVVKVLDIWQGREWHHPGRRDPSCPFHTESCGDTAGHEDSSTCINHGEFFHMALMAEDIPRSWAHTMLSEISVLLWRLPRLLSGHLFHLISWVMIALNIHQVNFPTPKGI